jgi:hypothetical protein
VKQKQLCALCGINTATTREHVPPKSIFLQPRPNNLITIPCCKACNNGSSKSDEKFKVYLGLHAAMYSPNGEKLFQEALKTLNRSPKLKSQVLEGLIDIDAKTPAGLTLLGYKGIKWDNKTYVSTLTKISKGLFFHHFGCVVPDDIIVKDYFFNSMPITKLSILNEGAVNEDSFRYYFGYAEGTSIWIYKFYNALYGAIILVDKQHKDRFEESTPTIEDIFQKKSVQYPTIINPYK